MFDFKSRVLSWVFVADPEREARIVRLTAELAACRAEIERLSAVPLAIAGPSEPVVKARGGKRAGPVMMSAEAFWTARAAACDRAGDRWAYDLDSFWVTLPAKWRKRVTERGTVLRWNADMKMPAVRYWDHGVLPFGLVPACADPVMTDWDTVQDAIAAVVAAQIEADRALRGVDVEVANDDGITDDIPDDDADAGGVAWQDVWASAVRAGHEPLMTDDDLAELEAAD